MKRQRLAIVIASALLLSNGASIVAPNVYGVEAISNAKTGTIINVNNAANVRSGPSTSNGVIGTMPKYETFEVIRETNYYYEVPFGNGSGYISKSVAELDDSSYIATIVGVNSAANVRSGPDSSYSNIGQAPKDSTVEVFGEYGTYSKVKLSDGTYGYVFTKYLERDVESNVGTIISNIKVNSAANVRSDASTSASIITTIPKGQSIEVVGAKGNYYIIKLSNGSEGYVSKSLVATTGNVTATVNVRKEPSTSSEVLGTLASASKIEVVSDNGWFYEVNRASGTAYISKNYAKLDGELPV